MALGEVDHPGGAIRPVGGEGGHAVGSVPLYNNACLTSTLGTTRGHEVAPRRVALPHPTSMFSTTAHAVIDEDRFAGTT